MSNNLIKAEILEKELFEYIKVSYPNIEINVIDEEDESRHLYFIEEKFALLFPMQRYHYLIHLIPNEFYNKHLSNTIWHELAPNENVEELDYHDEETIESIKSDVLGIIEKKTDFIEQLDFQFSGQNYKCYGDFSHSKKILTNLTFTDEEQFDIFHVFMSEGGYCDCEILYNIFKNTNYSKKYWEKRNS